MTEKLRELLARVESATGPDRELDRDIYEFVIKGRSERVEWDVIAGDYTKSIDAAVALCERVLPGYGKHLEWRYDGRKQKASLGENALGLGETMPLAICAAILRAKIALAHP